MTIGFIGLGNMGAHMVRNLLRKGHRMIVYDAVEETMSKFRTSGVALVDNPAAVAKDSDLVVTMLPNSPHVRQVYTGEDGLFKTLKSGSMCLDCSTIDQDVSQEMARLAGEQNAVYLDAPVSGGIMAAENAGLTFMVGGSKDDFIKAETFLIDMGKAVIHCGDRVGSGQAAKICNNMLLAISMIGVSETMNLGQSMGLDADVLTQVFNCSSGRCWSSDACNPVPGIMPGVPSSRGYAGGFGTALMAKDLGLAQNAATKLRTPTPLGSLAHQLYRLLARNSQYNTKDFSVIYQFLKLCD